MRRTDSRWWRVALCVSVACFQLIQPKPLAAQQIGFCHSSKCKRQPPSCDAANKAWAKYKRDIKIVNAMFQEADSETMRALEEFDEAAADIRKDMLIGSGLGASVDAADEAAGEHDIVKMANQAAKIDQEAAEEIRSGDIDAAARIEDELNAEINAVNDEGWVTLEYGIAADLIHVGIWWTMYQDAVANFDRSKQSQLRMLDQADKKWKEVLADLAKANAQDAQCTADRKKLRQEQDLERRAAHYIENLEGGYHRADGSWQRQWVIHDRAYNDYQSAINAAKQILSPPPSSGSLMVRSAFRYAQLVRRQEPIDTTRLILAQAQRLDTLVKSVGDDIRADGGADSALVALYIADWRSTHVWIVRITKRRL